MRRKLLTTRLANIMAGKDTGMHERPRVASKLFSATRTQPSSGHTAIILGPLQDGTEAACTSLTAAQEPHCTRRLFASWPGRGAWHAHGPCWQHASRGCLLREAADRAEGAAAGSIRCRHRSARGLRRGPKDAPHENRRKIASGRGKPRTTSHSPHLAGFGTAGG